MTEVFHKETTVDFNDNTFTDSVVTYEIDNGVDISYHISADGGNINLLRISFNGIKEIMGDGKVVQSQDGLAISFDMASIMGPLVSAIEQTIVDAKSRAEISINNAKADW